jgi:hypothetical protein
LAAEIKRTAEAYKRGECHRHPSELLNRGPNKAASAKRLRAATKKTLKAKAKDSRFSYGQLAAVYRRGQGAYLSSGSRNVAMAAWAMGRVNSFVSGKRCVKLKSTPKKHDYLSRRAVSGLQQAKTDPWSLNQIPCSLS